MRGFCLHFCMSTIVWLPGVLAVIGAENGWNLLIVFTLILAQSGLIATVVAILADVTGRLDDCK